MSATKLVKVFYCCSNSVDDEQMRQKLENHLKGLERQRVITKWHRGMISPGQEWEAAIETQLKTADIILVLISSDFMASDYHWEVVIKQAMQQHGTKQSRVIPILLRPVLDTWKVALNNLTALPKGERAVTSWNPHDKAFANIAQGIKEVAEELTDPTYYLKKYSRQTWKVAIPVVRSVRNAFIYIIAVSWVYLFDQPRYRSRRRVKKIPIGLIFLIVLLLCGVVFHFIYQQPDISEIPSSDVFGRFLSRPNSTINSHDKGWIWLGIVKNNSGSFSFGEPLILRPEEIQQYPIIVPSQVPSPGDVVTVKSIVHLRKDKSLDSEILNQLQLEEKIVILQVESIPNSSRNLPYIQLIAKVHKCNSNCDR